jgi:hypothetical protein
VGKPLSFATDEQTNELDSPSATYNAQYRRVLGSNTLLEARYVGFWGYYYEDPIDPSPSRLDLGTGEYTGGGGFHYYADRTRNQLNVTLSNYAQAYGRHSFKFGVEIERSKPRSRYGYSDDITYLDYYGLPYQALSYSYDIEGSNRRLSVHAQDGWQVGRITANLGVRLDRIRGYSPALGETVYEPKLAVGPRLGVVVDVTGRGTSIAKAFWGRYFEGASFSPWQRGVPGRADFVSYEVLPGNRLIEVDRVSELIYAVNPDIDHLSMDEFNVSFERSLAQDVRLTAAGVSRSYGNFINGVIPPGRWAPFTYAGGLPGSLLTLYRLTNPAISLEDRLITNVDGFQYLGPGGNVIGTVDAYRDYKGFMLAVTKSLSNRWRTQASYVWSETKGSVGNSSSTSAGGSGTTGSQFLTPNQSLVNAVGLSENDRTHEFKLFAGYQIPKIEVDLNGYFQAISGRNYTAVRGVPGGTFNFITPLTINLEPRGSRRYDPLRQLDLRVEKTFRLEGHRLGVFVDFQNFFNNDAVILKQTLYPSRVIANSTVPFYAQVAVNGARQLTLGGRWTF